MKSIGLGVLLALGCALWAADGGAGGRSREARPPHVPTGLEVPSRPFDLMVVRPGPRTVGLSVVCYQETEGYVAYGGEKGALRERTSARTFRAGEPVLVELSGLEPNRRYHYQLRTGLGQSAELSFHTARLPGSGFVFTLQADSHLDAGTSPAAYVRSLQEARSAGPDFHIDLGDTFMTDKFANFREAEGQYLAQRYYLGLVGERAGVFLVLGNHDGEFGRYLDGTATNMAVWANAMRKRYFPNPRPDGFYTGNGQPHAVAGWLENYYAWQWGDGLFVVLDPFWNTPRARRGSDNWHWTLGADQYQWLERTLATSDARFKFVFIHNLVGGGSPEARGGVEAAGYYEWGGRSLEGREEFTERRPGWSAPIHRLLVRHRVSAVFHGHDHLYARQEREGVVYQEVPQPGHSRGSLRSAPEYGYREGVLLPSSGILRVEVGSERVRVEYRQQREDGTFVAADAYEMRPR